MFVDYKRLRDLHHGFWPGLRFPVSLSPVGLWPQTSSFGTRNNNSCLLWTELEEALIHPLMNLLDQCSGLWTYPQLPSETRKSRSPESDLSRLSPVAESPRRGNIQPGGFLLYLSQCDISLCEWRFFYLYRFSPRVYRWEHPDGHCGRPQRLGWLRVQGSGQKQCGSGRTKLSVSQHQDRGRRYLNTFIRNHSVMSTERQKHSYQ